MLKSCVGNIMLLHQSVGLRFSFFYSLALLALSKSFTHPFSNAFGELEDVSIACYKVGIKVIILQKLTNILPYKDHSLWWFTNSRHPIYYFIFPWFSYHLYHTNEFYINGSHILSFTFYYTQNDTTCVPNQLFD